MLFLRSFISTALAAAAVASALPVTAESVQERQLSALAGILPELGPILSGLLGDVLRREEHALERRQLGGGLGSLSSLTSLLGGGLGSSGTDGEAGTTGTGQVAGGGVAGESGNARAGKFTPGSGVTARQLGGGSGGGGVGSLLGSLGGLGGLLGGGGLGRRDIDVEPRQISSNGSPGLGGLLGSLGGLGGLLGGGGLGRRDDGTFDRRQLDAVTGLLSSLEPLLKGLGL